MPKYAQIDKATSVVIGFYDTDTLTYPNMPPQSQLFTMTDEQWTARLTTPYWVLQDGSLVGGPIPPMPATLPTS